MRFLIKIATRGRPDKFRNAMRNIYETIGTEDYLIIVSIDTDDDSMMPLLGEINTMKNTQGYAGKPNGKVSAINRDINPYEPWDILVNFSDDQFWTQHQWDKVIEEKYKITGPDCFLHFSDGHVNERLAVM
jgi:hypothetical protein